MRTYAHDSSLGTSNSLLHYMIMFQICSFIHSNSVRALSHSTHLSLSVSHTPPHTCPKYEYGLKTRHPENGKAPHILAKNLKKYDMTLGHKVLWKIDGVHCPCLRTVLSSYRVLFWVELK